MRHNLVVLVPVLLGALVARAPGQVHPELIVGCDHTGQLVVRFDATRAFPLPASRFPGIDRYADAMPGMSSVFEARPDEDLFPPDPESHLEFVLLGADEGMTVLNDHGTGTMHVGETFELGKPMFDTHPVWNCLAGEAGQSYALRLQVRDRTGHHAASEVIEPRFAPDDATELYVCPMSCGGGNTSPRPGTCPVCGMQLKLISARTYRVQVTPEGPADEPIRAGLPTPLDFRVEAPDGQPVTDLQVVHEKLMHLLVVSNDLSWFSHEHPLIQPDGSFRLALQFPHGGAFTLFHDFTPARVGMQVVPVELEVQGEAPPAVPLLPGGDKVTVDGLVIELRAKAPILSQLSQGLTLRITREGKPVTDLQPWLGAMGHLIVVSEDRGRFVHSHPLPKPPGAAGRTGPEVTFSALFPAPGRYKAWAQFQHDGRVITAPFVFDVVSPYPSPADSAPSAGENR